MNSIEQLEKEYAEKHAVLERNLELAKLLPTYGKTFSWIGDGGYIGNDKQPDKLKTVELAPWIFHSKFRNARHVAFRAPDEYPGYGELASKMQREYIRAVCDAFAPYIINIEAIKGHYASHVNSKWDWKAHRDYADAKLVATGQAEVTVNASTEYSGSSQLEFYGDIPEAGVVQVSLELLYSHKLMPRAIGVHRYGQGGPVSRVERWDLPIHKAVNVWKRGSGDYKNTGCTVEYLYSDFETALADYFA